MHKIKKFIALATLVTLFGTALQAQDEVINVEDSAAYYDGGRASYLSAALPVGALAAAAIIIATTNRHHHSNSSHRNNSHSSSSHAHFYTSHGSGSGL